MAASRCTPQAKTSDLHHTSVQIGLTINEQKTKILKINAGTYEPATIEGAELGEVESFTYLGSVMDKSGEADADVKTRISIQHAKKGLELQRNRHIHQCKVRLFNLSIFVWSKDMADNQGIYEEDPDFYKSVLT